MSGKIKNKTEGEGSNLFTVPLLRFLIIFFCTALSLKTISLYGCHVEHSRDTWFKLVHIDAPGDSSKNKYDINDPRNPHCPCHQYQKLADKEFERLQRKEKNKMANSSNEESLGVHKTPGKLNSGKDLFWFSNKKRKFNNNNVKTCGHHSMKRRISDKLSRCFHF